MIVNFISVVNFMVNSAYFSVNFGKYFLEALLVFIPIWLPCLCHQQTIWLRQSLPGSHESILGVVGVFADYIF